MKIRSQINDFPTGVLIGNPVLIFGCSDSVCTASMTRFLLEKLKWHILILLFLLFFNFFCQNSCRSSKRHRNLEEFWSHMISLIGVLGELLKEVASPKANWASKIIFYSVWRIFKAANTLKGKLMMIFLFFKNTVMVTSSNPKSKKVGI